MELESVFEWLGKLNGLPGYALVFCFCVGACFVLTKWKRFPNDGIWLVATLLGCALNAMIADPGADGFSFRIWLVKNVLVGGICGVSASLVYAVAVKRLLAKFGVNPEQTDLKQP